MMASLLDAKPSSEPMLQNFKQVYGSACEIYIIAPAVLFSPIFLNNAMWKNIQPILRIQVQYNGLKCSYDQ